MSQHEVSKRQATKNKNFKNVILERGEIIEEGIWNAPTKKI